jgi:transcriptional regulator with XRE-family HTH domain
LQKIASTIVENKIAAVKYPFSMSKPPARIGFRPERLKYLREQRNLSQSQLARRCGFSVGLISKYEFGESDPAGYFLKILAEQLAVSADYLLGITDDPRGHLGEGQMTDEESQILNTFRRDGWSGVARLSVERITK